MRACVQRGGAFTPLVCVEDGERSQGLRCSSRVHRTGLCQHSRPFSASDPPKVETWTAPCASGLSQRTVILQPRKDRKEGRTDRKGGERPSTFETRERGEGRVALAKERASSQFGSSVRTFVLGACYASLASGGRHGVNTRLCHRETRLPAPKQRPSPVPSPFCLRGPLRPSPPRNFAEPRRKGHRWEKKSQA